MPPLSSYAVRVPCSAQSKRRRNHVADMSQQVCLWHIADSLSRLAACPLPGAKRTDTPYQCPLMTHSGHNKRGNNIIAFTFD